ncbi:Ribosomal protein S4 (RPS4A) family protein [Trifolium repens]|nr:Ribosomal protein S4 (RPS4A) family protein [Trifolium repens]
MKFYWTNKLHSLSNITQHTQDRSNKNISIVPTVFQFPSFLLSSANAKIRPPPLSHRRTRHSTSSWTLAHQSFSLRPTATRRCSLSPRPPLYLSKLKDVEGLIVTIELKECVHDRFKGDGFKTAEGVHAGFKGAQENARGLKRHLKRLKAPKQWMLDKFGGAFLTEILIIF